MAIMVMAAMAMVMAMVMAAIMKKKNRHLIFLKEYLPDLISAKCSAAQKENKIILLIHANFTYRGRWFYRF